MGTKGKEWHWNNTTRLESGYRGLANAIVYKAAMDYKNALKNKGGNVEMTLSSCRRFFRGDWFKALCTLDGDYILRKIEEQVKEETTKKNKKDRK